jgi:hypothetical protein
MANVLALLKKFCVDPKGLVEHAHASFVAGKCLHEEFLECYSRVLGCFEVFFIYDHVRETIVGPF